MRVLFQKWFVLLSAAVIIAGCGGGGGGGSADNTDTDDTTYNINGSVQKGPFIKGTTITIQELDKNLTPTGKTYSTETTDDFGKFSLQSNLSSPYVEITASGYYFDEVTGVLSTAPLTLRAIADLSDSASANVNILTTLEKNRLISLVQGGKSFTEAKTQAEGEILNIFNIKDNLSYFEEMDISKQGDNNAILLSVSAILDNVAVTNGAATNTVVAELSQLIATIGSDIETDGILDNATYKTAITSSSTSLDIEQVEQNLIQRYSDLGVSITMPAFENYIDSDGDGLLNKDDFVISFNWVENAALSTTYISNAVTVVLPSGTSATANLTDTMEGGFTSLSGSGYCGAAATNASLVVNGIDSGNKTANVSNGDTIAIELTSSASYNCDAYNSVTIAGNTGGFGVRTKMMQLSLTGTYSGNYRGLALSGTTAYLTGSKKLQILDLSNASSPTLIGEEDSQITTPSGSSSSGNDIALSGNQVNVALNATALQFLDASNPALPSIQSTFSAYGIDYCGGYMSAMGVSPDGNKVYGTDSCSHFFILDLTNPASPVMLKNYSFNMADQIVISKNGQKAFAAAGNVLNIIDISDSNNPALLSQSTTIGAIGLSGLALSPDETKAYTSGCNGMFNIIDVTNYTTLALLSTLDNSNKQCSSGDGGDSVAISNDGKKAYVASGSILRVFDVSNPAQPYLLGSINLPGNAHGVALSSDETKAYIATEGGLQVITMQ